MMDEVDVFYVPHLRMKQLVKACLEQVIKPDILVNSFTLSKLMTYPVKRIGVRHMSHSFWLWICNL
jgi:hypothetical protein